MVPRTCRPSASCCYYVTLHRTYTHSPALAQQVDKPDMAASLPSHAILAAAAGASCISSGRRAAQAAPALRRPALCQRRRLAAAAAPAAAATALLEPASIKIVKLDRKAS